MADTTQVRAFLWTVPRSLGTVLTKCFSELKGVQIIKEPYAAAHFIGPDKVSFEDDQEFHQNMKVASSSSSSVYSATSPNTLNLFVDSICTYRWVKEELLEAPYKGKSVVFCHDQAYCLDSRYDSLPTGYRHTFLIRNPLRVFPSWKKQLMPLMPSYVDRAFGELPMMPEGYGYEELYLLMEMLRSSGREATPIVIDADDLQRYPDSILKQYCSLIGIPFSRDLLQWNCTDEVMHSWIMSKTIFDDVQTSGWFSAALGSRKFEPPGAIQSIDELDADLRPMADASMSYYSKMHLLRIKP